MWNLLISYMTSWPKKWVNQYHIWHHGLFHVTNSMISYMCDILDLFHGINSYDITYVWYNDCTWTFCDVICDVTWLAAGTGRCWLRAQPIGNIKFKFIPKLGLLCIMCVDPDGSFYPMSLPGAQLVVSSLLQFVMSYVMWPDWRRAGAGCWCNQSKILS